MKNFLSLIARPLISAGIFLIITGIMNPALASETAKEAASYHFPPIKTHRLTSVKIGQTYEIRVMVPVSKTDGSERFPVLYMTDANGGIPMGETARIMQTAGELSRFIIVGIGYPVDNMFHSLYLRQRDLTPNVMTRKRYPFPIEDIVEITSGKKMGGAPEFLDFIQNELKPFINANYNTIADDSGYFGISLGGLFGLYVLFNAPETFNRYVIGSPAIWWGDEIIFSQAKRFLGNNDTLNANIYMAVGGIEEIAEPNKRYVSNVYKMDALLRSKPLTGLTLKTALFPDIGHTSAFGILHSRGLRAVFGPTRCAPFQDQNC